MPSDEALVPVVTQEKGGPKKVATYKMETKFWTLSFNIMLVFEFSIVLNGLCTQ